MNCKKCLHYGVCGDPDDCALTFCRDYSDKSNWAHLPCKAGERVFSIVVIGGEYTVVADRITRVTLTEKTTFFNTNWFYDGEIGRDIFLTQEEAEKALEERRKMQ